MVKQPNNIKTSATSTSNSSVVVDRPNTTQAIKTEPPILTKAPQLPASQPSQPPPLQSAVNKPPPNIIQKSEQNVTIKKEVNLPTKASNISLQMPNISKVPEVPSATVPIPLLQPKLEPKPEPETDSNQIKSTPTPSSAPINPFGRGGVAPTPTTPVTASAFNNSKPPTLTPNTSNAPSTEKKQMPSLTLSTPLAPIISPLSESDVVGAGSSSVDSKDGKLSFGIVDDSLLSKSINTPKGLYFLLCDWRLLYKDDISSKIFNLTFYIIFSFFFSQIIFLSVKFEKFPMSIYSCFNTQLRTGNSIRLAMRNRNLNSFNFRAIRVVRK